MRRLFKHEKHSDYIAPGVEVEEMEEICLCAGSPFAEETPGMPGTITEDDNTLNW